MNGICGKAFGVNQVRFCFNEGEKYCEEIRKLASTVTRRFSGRRVWMHSRTNQTSSDEAPEDGVCGAQSAEGTEGPETIDNGQADVKELRSIPSEPHGRDVGQDRHSVLMIRFV